jgi:hypothetical protein
MRAIVTQLLVGRQLISEGIDLDVAPLNNNVFSL